MSASVCDVELASEEAIAHLGGETPPGTWRSPTEALLPAEETAKELTAWPKANTTPNRSGWKIVKGKIFEAAETQMPEDSLPLETQKHEDSRPFEDASEVPGSCPKRARHRILVFHPVFRFVSPCPLASGLELLRAVSSSANCPSTVSLAVDFVGGPARGIAETM